MFGVKVIKKKDLFKISICRSINKTKSHKIKLLQIGFDGIKRLFVVLKTGERMDTLYHICLEKMQLFQNKKLISFLNKIERNQI